MAINRTDAPPADWPEFRNQVITGVIESSAALSAFPTSRTSTKLTKIPVIAGKPTAAFVDENLASDTSTKPKSKVTFTEASATMETLAVIIPIKNEVAADLKDGAGIDVWSEVSPQVSEALGYAIDKAILFGDGAPTSWGLGLSERASAANSYVEASNPVTYDDFNEAFAQVEGENGGIGYDVNTVLTHRLMRHQLRGMKDNANRPIYLDNVRGDGATGQILGANLTYGSAGGWDRTASDALVGDSSMIRVFIREELSVKFSEDAAYHEGETLVSALEKNVTLCRFELRLGWVPLVPRGGFPFCNLAPNGGGS